MPSVQTRIALAGGKYLITHPRSRVTKLVVPFVARRVARRFAAATHADVIPATRGSRLVTVVGIGVVAGAIVLVVRRTTRSSPSDPVVAPASPVFPPPAAAVTVVPDGDDVLVARVEAKLFGDSPPSGVTVESLAGVVTLRGRVADEIAEGRFVRDAETVEGVKAVQSELQTVGGEPDPPPS